MSSVKVAQVARSLMQTGSSDEVALISVVIGNVVNRDQGIATVRDSKLDKAAYVHLGGEEAYDLGVNSHLIGYTRRSTGTVQACRYVMELRSSEFTVRDVALAKRILELLFLVAIPGMSLAACLGGLHGALV